MELKTGAYVTGLFSLIGALGCTVYALCLYDPVRGFGGDVLVPLRVLLFAGLALTAVCGTVVTSLLIHGTRKGKPGLLEPWMVATILGLILHLAQTIFFSSSFRESQPPTMIVLDLVGFILPSYLLL